MKFCHENFLLLIVSHDDWTQNQKKVLLIFEILGLVFGWYTVVNFAHFDLKFRQLQQIVCNIKKNKVCIVNVHGDKCV